MLPQRPNYVRIRIISDVHLEKYNESDYQDFVKSMKKTQRKAYMRNIALLGDMCCWSQRYKDLLNELSSVYQNIFVLPGNHEYYIGDNTIGETTRKSFLEINTEMRSFCNTNPQIHFVDRDIYAVIPRSSVDKVEPILEFEKRSTRPKNYVIVLGATLWGNIPASLFSHVETYRKDSRCIYVNEPADDPIVTVYDDDDDADEDENDDDQKLKAEPKLKGEPKLKNENLRKIQAIEQTRQHIRDRDWIQKTLMERYALDERIVVLTHHAPSNYKTSHPKYDDQIDKCIFSTDLEYLFEWNVHTWVFGHTHWQVERTRKNVKLLSNPVGKGNELELQNQKFKPNMHIFVEFL